MSHTSEYVETAARWLLEAPAVCVSTGAGMSVESGLDTFRGADGLWSKVRIEDMATPEAFRRDPLKVWAWYRARRQRLAAVEPHDGHRMLAQWEQRIRDFTLVTQNIDGLHHRAGSQRVIELHGRLDTARCTACEFEKRSLDDLGEDPHCPRCQQRLRPAVVWFGEALPEGAIEAAFAAAQRCAVLLIVGTSGVVQPAASLADVARGYGARLIELNPEPTELSHLVHLPIRLGCRAGLTEIDAAWRRLGS